MIDKESQAILDYLDRDISEDMIEPLPEDLLVRMNSVIELANKNKVTDCYTCDCTKNYGKSCKHPDKYASGGCN